MPAVPTPETRDAPSAPRRRLLAAAGIGSLMVGGAAGLSWALAALLEALGGAFAAWAAPAAAALAVGLVGLPLAGLLFRLLQEVERSRRQLARLDTVDTLTGVANRAHFLALAEREWARARRYGGEPALLLIEIDRFQRLCDSRGAPAGDAVLREIVKNVSPTLRGADALARYGGAQLAVWLAQADPIGALDVADRIRERVEGLEIAWMQQPPLRVTVSVGVAALRSVHHNLSALTVDAEAAAQAARQAGGNCVRAAPVDAGRSRRIGPSVGDNQAAGPI
jgi:diguanylate cyclase